MRRADHVIEGDKFRILRWFFFKNVEGGTGNFSRFEGVIKVFFADDSSAGTIDDEDTLSSFCQRLLH